MSWVDSTDLVIVHKILSRIFTWRPDEGYGQVIVDRCTIKVPEYLIGGMLGRAYVNYKERMFRVLIHLPDKKVWLYYDHDDQTFQVKDWKKGDDLGPIFSGHVTFRF